MMRVGTARRGRLIQEFLDTKRIRISDLARTVDISYSVAYETVMGKQNNRKVLLYLLELGADPEYMDLPAKLRQTVGEVV